MVRLALGKFQDEDLAWLLERTDVYGNVPAKVNGLCNDSQGVVERVKD